MFFAFSKVKRRANKYVQFEFHEEVVLNGMIVTTYQGYHLKSFRVRANNDLNNPHLLTVNDSIASTVREPRRKLFLFIFLLSAILHVLAGYT